MTITPRQERQSQTLAGGAENSAWPSPWIKPPLSAWSQSRLHSPEVRLETGGRARGPNALLRLHVERAQSPWLDHLTREALSSGRLGRMVTAGVRGVTANPTVLARALESSTEYDEQLSWLFSTGCTAEETYRELAATDVLAACAALEAVYRTSQGLDGFVSIEVAPDLALRTRGAMAAARRLHQRIDRPNLLVAVPATLHGIPAIQAMVSSGRSLNATSIFSIDRCSAVIDAYLAGLETLIAQGGNPAAVHGLASFSLSPVDAEVDRRLEQLGGQLASELSGLAAVAQATLAYRLFEERFSTERWTRLAHRGATPLRLMWTSTHKSPHTDAPTSAHVHTEPTTVVATAVGYGTDHLNKYVGALAMANTAHALSESTVVALMRNAAQTDTLSLNIREAAGVLSDLGALGVDLDKVALRLEAQYADKAQHCLATALSRLRAKQGNR